jgi:two-component system, chemotaxis family, chemotaxis protein CheY
MRELKSVDKLAMSQRARNNLPAGLTLGSFTAESSVMTDVLPLSALIVGEHSSIAVAAVLNQLGATLIQHAENGAAALVLMRDRSYDLIISDWAMEPVNGLQLLKFVRAEPGFSRVRFILACPRGNRAAAVAIRGAGADGVLVEPSSPEMIRRTILEVLHQTP